MAKLGIKDQKTGHAGTVELTGPVFSIGKSADNHLVLDRHGISRKHAEILTADDGNFLLRDPGSRNGTFVDGNRVSGTAPVRPGQTIQIADFSMVIQAPASTPAPKTPAPQTPEKNAAAPQAAPAPATRQPAIPQAAPDNRKRTPPQLKKRIHARLLEELDLKHTDVSEKGQDELWQHTAEVCRRIVSSFASELPDWLAPEALVKEVVDEAVALGPLEELLEGDEISEIMVINWDTIYIEKNGKVQLSAKQFTDNNQVVAVMRRILAPIGRRIDETTPMQDGRLHDGSRVNAVIGPVALSGPCLTIRKFSKNPFVINDLVERFSSLTFSMAEFLDLAVKHRSNVLISGGTGSGKTTLLNVLSNFIPNTERIVTVEDAAELQLGQDHVVRMESRPANLEGKNAIPIRDLVRNCLRMRPDRIVVGECRGGEALDMLQAMNTGHDGSLTTLHANSPRDAISRLETLVLMAGMDLPSRAIREQIASAVDLIVQISRLTDGSRKVKSITAVTGMEGDIVSLQEIFRFDQKGFDEDGKVIGAHEATGMIPEFVQDMRRRGIPVNMEMFRVPKEDGK